MREVPYVVGSDLALIDPTAKDVERLRRALSVVNPAVIKAKRLNRDPGPLPERIDAVVELPDGSCRAPRGAIDVVREVLAKNGATVRIARDERATGEELGALHPIDLRDYQSEGVRLIRARLQGVIILPCGGGKTRLGVGAIPSIGRATLVLAHTDDLLDQWVATARALLRPVDGSEITIGLMNAERKETEASIVVGSVKTVDAYLKVHPEWGRRFGFVILDEAHHAPAETFQSVLMRLPARWRLGLTATIDREDGLTKFIDWSFGPRLLEKDAPELIALGHLMRPELEFVSSAFEFAFAGPDRKKGAALDLAIENDEARNALIAELAARDGKAGETVLVLAHRKTHCRALCRLIWEAGQEAAVLIGTTRKTARRDTIEGMRDGGVRVVVATSLADEGLDVQRLSRIVLAYPQRAKAPTIQRLGRLMRRFEGKKPRLYDIVDPLVDTLASRASARKRVYRQLGILR